jgi:hypothetical protein
VAEIGWASLGIVPTFDKGFDSKLSRGIDPALGRVGRDSGKRFGGILGKAAVAGAAGLIGAGFAAFKLGKDALGEAREAQEVGRTTAAILKATGGAAKLSRKEYDRLTASLMRKTAIDDEQIATGGNLLLTFKNVKREGKGLNDVFGRGLASALDISAAGFGSIDGASKMLGKALNDPIKGVTALSRAGVTFSDDQKTTIERMVETNDLLGAQKLILKEVESQVGGTAAKQKTSAKELETAWGNVKEEIGFALIPVMEDLADFLLDKGVPAAEKFGDWLKDDGIPAIRDFVDDVKPLAKKLLPAAADALGVVRDIGKDALPYIEDLVGAFNDMPGWAKKALVGGGFGALALGKVLPDKKGGLLGSGGGLLGLKPVPVFVTNMGKGGLDGGLGTDGKSKGGKGGKLPFIAGASPYLLPLLLGGDSAPGQNKRSDTGEGVVSLLEMTGAESDEELREVFSKATTAKIREFRKTLKEELGLGFREVAEYKAHDGSKPMSFLNDFNARDTRRQDRAVDKFFKVTPKGVSPAMKDFERLIGLRDNLNRKKIEPKVRVDTRDAKRELRELQGTIDKLAASIADLQGTGGVGGLFAGLFPQITGPTYNGPVTYTDDEQGRRDARTRGRRAGSDGVNRR